MEGANKTFYGRDASKYPSRFGKSWSDDEIVKLLSSIQKKKSVEEIAKEHERTVGSINSYIQKLAIDYHYNDKRSMDEIQKFTGLTKAQIEDSIKKHEIKKTINKSVESSKSVQSTTVEVLPTISDVVMLLKDIQQKLTLLVERGE